MLGLLPYRDGYWSLAATTRRARSCIISEPCNFPRGSEQEWENNHNACLYDQLLGTWDLLQRNAYFKVRDNVHLAIGDRLPAELVHDVFEQVLEAEGIPLDPRVIVELKGTIGGRYRKTRFPYKHELKVVRGPLPEDAVAMGGLDFQYTFIDNPPAVEECLPVFPLSGDSAHQLSRLEQR